jgi:hypothetical protein
MLISEAYLTISRVAVQFLVQEKRSCGHFMLPAIYRNFRFFARGGPARRRYCRAAALRVAFALSRSIHGARIVPAVAVTEAARVLHAVTIDDAVSVIVASFDHSMRLGLAERQRFDRIKQEWYCARMRLFRSFVRCCCLSLVRPLNGDCSFTSV